MGSLACVPLPALRKLAPPRDSRQTGRNGASGPPRASPSRRVRRASACLRIAGFDDSDALADSDALGRTRRLERTRTHSDALDDSDALADSDASASGASESLTGPAAEGDARPRRGADARPCPAAGPMPAEKGPAGRPAGPAGGGGSARRPGW